MKKKLPIGLTIVILCFSLVVWAKDSPNSMVFSQSGCDDVLLGHNIQSSIDFNFANDLNFIAAIQQKDKDGVLQSFRSKKFDTPIYHTATALPNQDYSYPVVDPKAKALYVFVHGSGTLKSSGQNFRAQLNELASLGFAGLSFDMPFHGDGPTSNKFDNPQVFIDWIREIIAEYRVPGMPVYLVGHSYGPDVVAEYLTRYPFDIDGGVMLSPASFNKKLKAWYNTHTSRMKFGGDVPANIPGGNWSDAVAKGYIWKNGQKELDPTLVNPSLRLRILTGNLEEYVPAPTGGKDNTPIGENTYDLKAVFKGLLRNATVTVEDGIGHYLFNHTTPGEPTNVVLRELMLVAGYSPDQAKAMIIQTKIDNENNLTSVEKILSQYTYNTSFRAWVRGSLGEANFSRIIKNNNEIVASKVLDQYRLQNELRLHYIYQAMQATQSWAPDFYQKYVKNQKDINNLFYFLTAYLAILLDNQATNDNLQVIRSEEQMSELYSINSNARLNELKRAIFKD